MSAVGTGTEQGLLPSFARVITLDWNPRLLAKMLQVKRLTGSSKLLYRGSEFSAGYDLYASESVVVKSKGRALVPTGIAISVPPGTYGRIAPRSGLAESSAKKTGVCCGDHTVNTTWVEPGFTTTTAKRSTTSFAKSSARSISTTCLLRIPSASVLTPTYNNKICCPY